MIGHVSNQSVETAALLQILDSMCAFVLLAVAYRAI